MLYTPFLLAFLAFPIPAVSDDAGGSTLPTCVPSGVQLSDSNFSAETSEGRWLVLFYTQWCDVSCTSLCPVLGDLPDAVSKGADGLAVALVDASANPETSSALGVRSFPWLVYIDHASGLTGDPYLGPRDLDSVASFCERMVGDPVGSVEPKCEQGETSDGLSKCGLTVDGGPSDSPFPIHALSAADLIEEINVAYDGRMSDDDPTPTVALSDLVPGIHWRVDHPHPPFADRRRLSPPESQVALVAGHRPLGRDGYLFDGGVVSWFVLLAPKCSIFSASASASASSGKEGGKTVGEEIAEAFGHEASARRASGRFVFARVCDGGSDGSENGVMIVSHPGGYARRVYSAGDVMRFVSDFETPAFAELGPAVFDHYASSQLPLVLCVVDKADTHAADAFAKRCARAALDNVIASDESSDLENLILDEKKKNERGNDGENDTPAREKGGKRERKKPRRVAVGVVDGVRWSDFAAHYGVSLDAMPVSVGLAPDGSEYYPEGSEGPESLINALAMDGSGLRGVTPGSTRGRRGGDADDNDDPSRDREQYMGENSGGDAAGAVEFARRNLATIAMAAVAIAAFFAGRAVAPAERPKED